MRLLIVRHGDPDYENDTLTDLGRREAEALAHRLAGAGVTQLFSSPMGRATATAEPSGAACGLPVEVLPWAAELRHMPRVTDASGREVPAWNAPGELVRGGLGPGTSPNPWAAFCQGAYGQRLKELATASDAFLAGFGYERHDGVYLAPPDDDHVVAVVCHNGFGLAWLAHLLALPTPLVWCGLFLAPTSVTTVLWERRSDRLAVPRALSVGDASHVAAAGLPPSSRGLTANHH